MAMERGAQRFQRCPQHGVPLSRWRDGEESSIPGDRFSVDRGASWRVRLLRLASGAVICTSLWCITGRRWVATTIRAVVPDDGLGRYSPEDGAGSFVRVDAEVALK